MQSNDDWTKKMHAEQRRLLAALGVCAVGATLCFLYVVLKSGGVL